MDAHFGPYPILPNSRLSWVQAQQLLMVKWPFDPAATYMMIVYDLDAPRPYTHPFVQYLVTDLHNDNLMTGRILVPYMSPNPVNGTHRYVIEIYQQIGAIVAQNYSHTTTDPAYLLHGHVLIYSLNFLVDTKN